MTTNLFYLNGKGETTLNVTLINASAVVQHIYDAERNLVTPTPGQTFKDASVSTAVTYYADGNLAQIITRSADGSKVEMNFSPVPNGGTTHTYGPNNEYTVGPLASVREYSTTKQAQENWEYYQNGMLTGYSLLSTDPRHPLKLTMEADPAQPGGDSPKLLVTLTNENHAGAHALTVGADYGNFDSAYWISKNAAKVVSENGMGLISQDGAGLISQDGAGIISQDGAGLHAYSVISNDGSSFNSGVVPTSSLISNSAASIMSGVSEILIRPNLTSLFPTNGVAAFEHGNVIGQGDEFANARLEKSLNDIGGLGTGRQYALTSTSDPVPVDKLTDGIDDAAPLGIGSVSGSLEGSNRSDWYEVSLVAGHTYVFDMKGASSTGSADSLADPLLRLFDADHVLVKSADDGGIGQDSKLVYQPTASGTFYVSARGYNDVGDGSYQLDFSEGSAAPQILSNGGGDSATINMMEYVNPGDSDTVTIVSGWDLIDGNTLKYSISGEDAAQFDLNSFNGYLSFHALPDHETPRDANHDDSYHVTVTATDSQGNTDSQDLTINVLDVAERLAGISQYIFTNKAADITWSEAKSEAEAMGGQLASIGGEHSVDEQNYILGILAENPDLFVLHAALAEHFGPWIGLTQADGSAEPGGGWAWLSGEAYQPFGWHSGQPDNYVGDNRGHFYSVEEGGAIGWSDNTNTPPPGYPQVQSFLTEFNVATANLAGTEARDLIYAADIKNTIDAGGGDDYVSAGGGDDVVSGAEGDDVLEGGAGNDSLDGGDGNDTLRAGNGNGSLSGGDGDDLLDSGRGNATVDGGLGTDQWKADLSLLGAGVTVDVSDPSETQTLADGLTIKEIERLDLVATDKADVITLGARFAAYGNAVSTGFGDDIVVVRGGATADTSGTNTIEMGAGDEDLLIADYSAAKQAVTFAISNNIASGLVTDYSSDGSNGAKYDATGRLQFSGVERFAVTTGSSNDSIVTGDGDDVLDGGRGNDMLTGGRGKDSFIFDARLSKNVKTNPANENVDTISDFDHKSDTIYLDDKIFKDLAEGTLSKSSFTLISNGHSTVNVDPQDRILYDKRHGDLYFDRDGSKGQYDRVLFAHVEDGAVVNQTDFEIV